MSGGYSSSSFSCLDARKGSEKKTKAPPGPGKFGRRDLFTWLLIEFDESLEGLEGAATVDGLGGFGDAVGQRGVGAHEADGEGGIGDDGLLLRGCRTVLEHAAEDVGGFVGCCAAIKLLRTESREA